MCSCGGTSANRRGCRSAGTATRERTIRFDIARREAAEETGLEDLVAWPSAEIVHVVVVPVPAGKGEPAHEHADVRYVLATSLPESARPESDDAPMQWLSVEDALALTEEENLRESLRRVAELFAERQ